MSEVGSMSSCVVIKLHDFSIDAGDGRPHQLSGTRIRDGNGLSIQSLRRRVKLETKSYVVIKLQDFSIDAGDGRPHQLSGTI